MIGPHRKTFAFVVLGVVSVIQPTQSAEGSELRSLFDAAVAEYDEGQQHFETHPDQARRLFHSAANRFSSILAAGVINGRLEFNLGNCYLQAGEVGKAILHYRRAMRLIPRDVMLAENLAVARSRCLTHIPPTRRSAVLSGLFFWHHQTSLPGRTRAALLCYAVFWCAMFARTFRRSGGLTAVTATLALACVASAASVAVTHWADRHEPDGVVIGADVPVYRGPGTSYQRQFEEPLQPGVEFTLRERTAGGWWRIELADGKTGWIDAEHADLVPTERSPFRVIHSLSTGAAPDSASAALRRTDYAPGASRASRPERRR